MFNMSLSQRIKNRRMELNMTQTELARKLGYRSRSSINKIEQGQNDLPQSKIEAIAKALKCPPAYLMGWEDLPGEKEATQAVPLRTVTLRPDEAALLGSYNKLNDTGKEKAAEYVTDLAGNKKYTALEDVGRMSG